MYTHFPLKLLIKGRWLNIMIHTLLLTSQMEMYGSPYGGCRRCNSTKPHGSEHNFTSE